MRIFTVGTGKSGSHTIHEAMQTIPNMVSIHEPSHIYLDREECYYYATPNNRHLWERPVRSLFSRPLNNYHLAGSHYLVFHKQIDEYNPGCLFLNPYRDFESITASLVAHGAYTYRGPHFITPRTPLIQSRWWRLSQIEQVAWMVHTKHRIEKRCAEIYGDRWVRFDIRNPPDLHDVISGWNDAAQQRLSQTIASSPPQLLTDIRHHMAQMSSIADIQSGVLDENIDHLF